MPCKKVRHPTADGADAHRASLMAEAKDHPSRLARLNVYFCYPCVAWHVGHGETRAQVLRRRKVRARES